MKKNKLKYSYLLVAILILIGCDNKKVFVEHEISKNGSIGLENIVEIHSKYFQYEIVSGLEWLRKFLISRYNYTGELTQEALEKAYRLSFYVNFDGNRKSIYSGVEEGSISGVVLLPCDSVLEYADYGKYPANTYVQHIEYPIVKEYTYGAYFKIEDLEELGYIAKDQSQQKDLCLFEKARVGSMTTDWYISSNKLIYTADEINTIMDEYKALR